jgi:hypothetical protein
VVRDSEADSVKDRFGCSVWHGTKGREGNIWRVLAAGEGSDEDLGNWRRAAAVAQSTPRERESTSVG